MPQLTENSTWILLLAVI